MFGKMSTAGKKTNVFTSGKGKFTVDSNVYKAKIKGVYAFASGDGEGVTGILDFELTKEDGTTRGYKETVSLVSKEGNTTYTDEKTGAELLLSGASLLAEICAITCKQSPENMESSQTMIEVYDFNARGNKPKEVTCLPGLKDKEICLAIIEAEKYKNKKDGNEWVQTDEIKVENSIELVLQPETMKTLKELQAKVEDPIAYNTWIEMWKDKVKEPYKKGGKKGKKSGSKPKEPELSAESFGF